MESEEMQGVVIYKLLQGLFGGGRGRRLVDVEGWMDQVVNRMMMKG